MSKRLVIYHGGDCRDGWCSAWLMRAAFPDAEFIAANYGEPPPQVVGKDVYIVDFSYPRAAMGQIIATAGSVVVLDHHKTAEKELGGLYDEMVQGGIEPARKPLITFDMTKSGGRLTLDYLNARAMIPFVRSKWIVDYTEDRDLWLWKLPHSKEINAALRSYPLDFAVWDELAKRDPLSLIPEGAAILRAEEQIVDAHVRNAITTTIAGHVVPCVNATTLMSEILNKLAVGQKFAASFFVKGDGERVYSLRSASDGMDVSEVAKWYGGGGHKNAAGFQLPVGRSLQS